MTLTRWVIFLGLLTLAPLVVQALQLASTPPFTPGLPEGTPMRMGAEGITTELLCGPGVLLLRARLARPGHEDVATFRLGPSTHVDLRDVDVTYREGVRTVWEARGPQARLTADALEFTQPSTYLTVEAPPRPARALRIRLASGDVSFD